MRNTVKIKLKISFSKILIEFNDYLFCELKRQILEDMIN